jgi:hypothetical protein
MVHQEITPPAANEGSSILPSLGGLFGWGGKEEAKPAGN